MISKHKNIINQFTITIIAALLFVPFLGSVHLFDWDEINFAESAREMILTGDYLTVKIDFNAFWEKPPLFAWIQVLSMKTFGINEFAARFPNAIIGIVTLLLLFNIGKKLYNEKFGLLWVLVYAGSILPHFYFKSGLIDPLFNLFIFLGVYQFIVYSSKIGEANLKHVFLSAFFIGLGILTKGPVAFLLFLLSGIIFMIFKKLYKEFLNLRVIAIYGITVALIGGFWFILQALNGNYDILVKFIDYQIRLFTIEDAGHGGFLFYHFVVLFFGVFPASIFVLKSFRKYKDSNLLQTNFRQWMVILFWVVLILFTIVTTKIVHYSSMCYFPMSFLATYIIQKIWSGEQKFDRWMKITIAAIATVIGLIVILLQLIEIYKDKIIQSGLIKDDFAVGNLGAKVHWSGYEFLVGLLLVAAVCCSLLFIKSVKKQIIMIFASTILFVNLTMIVIVPLIEQYSQNAAIEFYKKIAKEDCYLDTYGFKSYAIYYYFDKKEAPKGKVILTNWLLTGDVDKPVYFVCKNFSEKEFRENYPDFKKVASKNGFVFFRKEKKQKD
jgi:4-amino-4-deoxy-L-arabinose transferase-like glycosyltransferase